MERMMVMIGASVGGAVGWWMGAKGGMMAAFFVSIVGTAVGVYFARRWVRSI